MLDIDPAAASLMLRGKRRMTPHEAHQISVILGTPLNEVMRHAGIDVTEDIHNCPVTAHVNEHGAVTLMPPGTHDLAKGPADCPMGTYAVQVRSHASIKDRWMLFVTPAQQPAEKNLDLLCLVATADGKQVMAVVRRGYRRDTCNLVLWPRRTALGKGNGPRSPPSLCSPPLRMCSGYEVRPCVRACGHETTGNFRLR